jgi:hypothetical protein
MKKMKRLKIPKVQKTAKHSLEARVFHLAAAADTPIDVGVGVHFALRQLALGRITAGGNFFSRNGSCRKLWIFFMHLAERALFTLVEMGKCSRIFFQCCHRSILIPSVLPGLGWREKPKTVLGINFGAPHDTAG